jgi:biotin carboxylase
MEKRVLLLCASHNDLGLIRALRKLGYYIVATGNQSGLIGEKYVDEYVQADYSDKELILKLAKEKKVDAICQCCNDFGVYTAAYVAEQLGLPGYDTYEITLLLHNKDKFKKFALEQGLITPLSYGFDEEKKALQWVKTAEYPLIVKPADASAGNGIHKVIKEEDAETAIKIAFSKSKVGHIVIERFITGTQHGFCTFLIGQKVVACCSNNEYSMLNPYRVEIDTFPSDNYESVKDILITQIEKIASILQLKDGIFHLQYIMDGKEPQIIEVMRRILGNMYSVPGNMLNGIDWDYWEVRARCGLTCKDFPQHINQEGFYAYKTILANQNGTIRSVNIPRQYQKYMVGKCILKKQGELIDNYKSQPIGFLFFQFSSMKEMKHILIESYRNDMVEMESVE